MTLQNTKKMEEKRQEHPAPSSSDLKARSRTNSHLRSKRRSWLKDFVNLSKNGSTTSITKQQENPLSCSALLLNVNRLASIQAPDIPTIKITMDDTPLTVPEYCPDAPRSTSPTSELMEWDAEELAVAHAIITGPLDFPADIPEVSSPSGDATRGDDRTADDAPIESEITPALSTFAARRDVITVNNLQDFFTAPDARDYLQVPKVRYGRHRNKKY
jgi:hypothetical protein